MTGKLIYKGVKEWQSESFIIIRLNSEKFISQNILKSPELNHIVENESNSNSSFSINSNKYQNKGMRSFNIEEESYEDDSDHRHNNFKMLQNLSIEQTDNKTHHQKHRHVEGFGLLSDTSSLNSEQRDRCKVQKEVLRAEQSHFDFHNLLFIGKSLMIAGHWFYHSRHDPAPYDQCPHNGYAQNAVNCSCVVSYFTSWALFNGSPFIYQGTTTLLFIVA